MIRYCPRNGCKDFSVKTFTSKLSPPSEASTTVKPYPINPPPDPTTLIALSAQSLSTTNIPVDPIHPWKLTTPIPPQQIYEPFHPQPQPSLQPPHINTKCIFPTSSASQAACPNNILLLLGHNSHHSEHPPSMFNSNNHDYQLYKLYQLAMMPFEF